MISNTVFRLLHFKLKRKRSILICFIALLFLIEAILRFTPTELTKIDLSLAKEERIYSLTRGFQNKPNFARNWAGLGPVTIWQFNNYGFRGPTIETNQIDGDLFRIVVLGDSITMGLGVEASETYVSQLQNILNPLQFSGGTVRIYETFNLGNWGYTTSQEAAVFDEVGIKLKPKIVIVQFDSSDPNEAYNFEKDKLYLNLRAIPDSLIPYRINQFLKTYSYTYLFSINHYYNFISRFQADIKPNSNNIQEGWHIVENSLLQIEQTAKKNDVQMIILGVPNRSKLLQKDQTDNNKRIQQLSSLAKKHKFNYLELTKSLQSYPKPEDLFIPDNYHFSRLGNNYVGQVIADYLIENNFISK